MPYGLAEWKKNAELNKQVLDKIEFPKPDQGEELCEYMDRVRDQYGYMNLPEEMDGDLFCFFGYIDLGEYLHDRYGWDTTEEIRYYIWF